MNTRKHTALLAGLIIGSLSFAVPSAAQTVYRAVDEQGNPAFTDRPEEYASAEAVSIKIAAAERRRSELSEADSAREAQAKAEAEALQLAVGIREASAADDAAAAAAKQEVLDLNCQKAQKRFDGYKDARRLYRTSEAGEKEFLNDAEMDAARAEAKLSADKWCGS